jgi:hypothetical protein
MKNQARFSGRNRKMLIFVMRTWGKSCQSVPSDCGRDWAGCNSVHNAAHYIHTLSVEQCREHQMTTNKSMAGGTKLYLIYLFKSSISNVRNVSRFQTAAALVTSSARRGNRLKYEGVKKALLHGTTMKIG